MSELYCILFRHVSEGLTKILRPPFLWLISAKKGGRSLSRDSCRWNVGRAYLCCGLAELAHDFGTRGADVCNIAILDAHRL